MTNLNPAQFIKQHAYGVLSTHSLAETEYPFGSITPYIITPDGDIAIYISELAEHTKNIIDNNKVSLTVFELNNPTNPNDGPRISCLAEAVATKNTDELKSLYLEKFPDAEMTLSLPGFTFYLLKLHKVRLVAGFGKVKWLSAEQIQF